MAIDFNEEFGVNAGYAETLFEQWRLAPDQVAPEWRAWFERLAPEAARDAASVPAAAEDPDLEIVTLRGIAARIAENMTASLEVPTATTVRSFPVKVLEENRQILNGHMKVRALGKASYTHLLAFALVRALREMPQMQSRYEERDGKGVKVTPRQLNLGLAIDVETPSGRSLVVPNIKDCAGMNFMAFYRAYQDVVQRGRDGKLGADDYRGTTASLTNPGGFGTEMSVPRLMKGQGLILATGTIGVPVHVRNMAPETRAELAIGPVVTVTSTYDHRVIQGAESGLLLKRVEDLLQGAEGFWDGIFRDLRVPWQPWRLEDDRGEPEVGMEEGEKLARVWQLINAYRVRGCRLADLDPLAYRPDPLESLDLPTYGFTIWDLDRTFPAGDLLPQPRATLRAILEVLRETYCRRWTLEYMHISNRARKHWVRARVEPRRNEAIFDRAHRQRILERLVRAENFERFLHTRYPGNKRFSLEGGDTLLPALAELVDRLAESGVERVVLSMAHRGRLNVLANILNKPQSRIFAEFEAVPLPLSKEGSGDVKYHLGQTGVHVTPSGKQVEVVLSANPSHLEAVDPVVTGMVRAFQDQDGDAERKRTVAVLVHGDAAFTGQGVVAETLQMSNLPAYRCGGTIHVVLNNQIGFTTGPKDLHSTYYCTDIAKMIQAPVLHANGDYPEAVLRAMHVATDYQREFGMDVVVDMVCYRRRGHNEGDEPAFTQPLLYRLIENHPTVRQNYIDLLVRRGQMTAEECQEISDRYDAELKLSLESSRAQEQPKLPVAEILDLDDDDPRDYCAEESPATGVPEADLVAIVERTNAIPEGVVVHPNLLRQLRRRESMVRGERNLDWGCAEVAAFGSLLAAGIPVRLAGQDSGRGTFSHRHAIIRDQDTGADWVPLAHLEPQSASFEVRDSLLSEEAALAFEYGYSLIRKNALVMWEAQFGDFVNGAQIPIDQFLAPGESKWHQVNGLTLLLPHGYDGQGPEHSSGRMERFLQLCAEGNLTVAVPSTAAQYFHLLRRQGSAAEKRPLIVFTPKSLLRDKRAASPIGEFAAGRFRELVGDVPADSAQVERLVFCSGKVFHDLDDFRKAEGRQDVALVRVEQLYPFPRAAALAEIERYEKATAVWSQEEPRNMGGWSHVSQVMRDAGVVLEYAGRPAASSPATGSYKRHLAEQEYLVRRAFGAAQPA
ncbi:MAG TPA: multifunctional oxoglutarate decarboxylase/oxoglutarate dehydrogenase thiamine pyrophosphate-binding subunit/dihydrolipoyllysine-residue succinyltransferase subunit [Planctomycetota bacterium]